MAKREGKTEGGEETELHKRLNDYAAVTRVSPSVSNLRGRVGNWPVYAAAVGSALAMATNASASVIHYCGSSNSWCGQATTAPEATAAGPEFHIPLLQTTAHQVVLEAGDGIINGFSGSANLFGAKVKFFDSVATTFLARKFNASAAIGASLITHHSAVLNSAGGIRELVSGNIYGLFAPGAAGFVGMALSDIGGDPTKTDYGWIQLVFTNQNGKPQTLTAIDWAVDTTPNEAILADQMPSSAPEPGTMALGLLASGAAGVTALRRRRKA